MNSELTYDQLLNLPEWKEKRKEIIKRDSNCCQGCSNRFVENGSQAGILDYPPGNGQMVIINLANGEKIKKHKNYFLKIGLKDHSVVYFTEKELNSPDLEYEDDESDEDKYVFLGSRRQLQTELNFQSDFMRRHSISPKIMASLLIELIGFQGHSLGNPVLLDRFKEERAENLAIMDDQKYVWNQVNGLHVHHKYYSLDRDPWEYPNEALITLCESCHHEIHENEDIPVYRKLGDEHHIGYYDPCNRCNGAGYIPRYHYYKNGICFLCDGKKYLDPSFIKETPR